MRQPATAKSRALTGDKSLSPIEFTFASLPPPPTYSFLLFASWVTALHKLWLRKTPIATDINQLMDADGCTKYSILSLVVLNLFHVLARQKLHKKLFVFK